VLRQNMTAISTTTHMGRDVYVGELAGKSVVVAESGVGMTNAAATLQRMIDVYAPSAVIMTGIAGGIDSSVRIGDIVVPDKWMAHDYGYYSPEGFEHRSSYVFHPALDSMSYVAEFSVDSVLLDAVLSITAEDVGLHPIGDRLSAIRVGGIGVSGNVFIDSKSKREWLSHTFAAQITDMESAGVAQICLVNDIPFIVFRATSDLAGGSGSETARHELQQFFEVAAGNSATVVMELLSKL